jgi:hypothetical protein
MHIDKFQIYRENYPRGPGQNKKREKKSFLEMSRKSAMTMKQRAEKMKNLICYCFGYTAFDIAQDVAANGKSTIMERILSEKKAGGCQCATKNPKGR